MINNYILYGVLITSLSVAYAEPERVDNNKNNKEKSFIKIDGDIILGAEIFNGFYNREGESQQELVLRRGKLGIDIDFNKNWKAQIEGKVEQNEDDYETEFGDVYLEYRGLKNTEITLGYIKEPFGFERLTGITKVHAAERSISTNAFSPGRNLGFSWSFNKKSWTSEFGFYQDEIDNIRVNALTGRLTTVLTMSDTTFMHFGIATSHRDLNQSVFEVKDRGGFVTADNVYRSIEFVADKSNLLGLEWMFQSSQLTIISELFNQSVTYIDGRDGYLHGGYIQSSFFADDTKLRYKKGKLKSVKPASDISWEWYMRFNWTDLRDLDSGNVNDTYEVGVNTYFGDFAISKLALIASNIEGQRFSPESNGKGVNWRITYLW
ncbi:porin [Pleionea sediminis]|uniref:porin n=1 Tax=Pleionea sediminis TaxID=2569479 RepID=UPI0013DDD5D1|nr:porin [Pleionea sediminis]